MKREKQLPGFIFVAGAEAFSSEPAESFSHCYRAHCVVFLRKRREGGAAKERRQLPWCFPSGEKLREREEVFEDVALVLRAKSFLQVDRTEARGPSPRKVVEGSYGALECISVKVWHEAARGSAQRGKVRWVGAGRVFFSELSCGVRALAERALFDQGAASATETTFPALINTPQLLAALGALRRGVLGAWFAVFGEVPPELCAFT